MRRLKKLISLLLCFATAVSLITVAKSTTVEAAEKKQIYVLDTIETPAGYTNKLSYNSKGLLTKNVYEGICTAEHKYNKKNQLIQTVVSIGDEKETYKYKYNKKGLRTTVTHTTFGGSKIVTKYKYKNNKMVKAGDFDSKDYTEYSYSGGKINKIRTVSEYYTSAWTVYTYDDYGNIDSCYNNEYEGKRIVSRTMENEATGDTEIFVFTYKKIKVDKKMINTIKKQQWSLINDDIDRYFDVAIGWG